MTQNPQRFSGRELGLLLSQVRDQLGEDATIVEANRLREGGIGGFFAKERYEVVATPGAVEPIESIESTEPTESAAGAGSVTAPAPALHVEHLLERAERVSGDERRDAGPRPVTAASAIDTAGLDEPGETDARFDAILRGALSDLTTGPAPGPTGGTPPPPPPAPPAPPTPPHIQPAPRPAPPPAQRPVVPAPPAAAAPGGVLRDLPGGAFWAGLDHFEQLLEDTPLTAEVTTVVGPLDDAVTVARHLARQAGIDTGHLVVVSDQRDVDGVPPWQVVDRRDDLTDRVRYWRAHDRPAVVVIELEAGERGLERTARNVEAAGGDLTRLVVPALDDLDGLAATLRGLGPVAAIDVSRPPRPQMLVDAVEQGVRIGTVCGRRLTAMLLAGLAATIDHG